MPARKRKVIHTTAKYRLLMIDGESGSVACRVHDQRTRTTIPRFNGHTFEFATRSFLRMKNLSGVRGKRDCSMIGPADYFGNLESLHDSLFSFEFTDGKPTIYSYPLSEERHGQPEITKRATTSDDISTTKVKWISGSNKEEINRVKAEYTVADCSLFGGSLFKNPGILEVAGSDSLPIKLVNATILDLTPFKARLVPNAQPFRITSERLPTSDEFRACSYEYKEGYAHHQVKHGGGLFLEQHDFAQTITPLDQHAGGYITLAKYADDKKSELETLAFRIPFGYTLIIEKGSIHGDTTINGMYMMAMTSNHKTMSTADTVFLKSQITKKNIEFILAEEPHKQLDVVTSAAAPKSLAVFKSDSKKQWKDFYTETKDKKFVFQPLSPVTWFRYQCLVIDFLIRLLTALKTTITHTAKLTTTLFCLNKNGHSSKDISLVGLPRPMSSS